MLKRSDTCKLQQQQVRLVARSKTILVRPVAADGNVGTGERTCF